MCPERRHGCGFALLRSYGCNGPGPTLTLVPLWYEIEVHKLGRCPVHPVHRHRWEQLPFQLTLHVVDTPALGQRHVREETRMGERREEAVVGPVVGEGKISDEKGAWAQQAGCESEGRVSGRMRGLGPSTEAQGRAPSTGPITLLLCYHGTLVCKQRYALGRWELGTRFACGTNRPRPIVFLPGRHVACGDTVQQRSPWRSGAGLMDGRVR